MRIWIGVVPALALVLLGCSRSDETSSGTSGDPPVGRPLPFKLVSGAVHGKILVYDPAVSETEPAKTIPISVPIAPAGAVPPASEALAGPKIADGAPVRKIAYEWEMTLRAELADIDLPAGATMQRTMTWPYELVRTSDGKYHVLLGGEIAIHSYSAVSEEDALNQALAWLRPVISRRLQKFCDDWRKETTTGAGG